MVDDTLRRFAVSCVEAVWDVREGRIRGGKTSVYDVWGEARKRDGASGIIKYWVVPPEMRCRARGQEASQPASSHLEQNPPKRTVTHSGPTHPTSSCEFLPACPFITNKCTVLYAVAYGISDPPGLTPGRLQSCSPCWPPNFSLLLQSRPRRRSRFCCQPPLLRSVTIAESSQHRAPGTYSSGPDR